MLAPIVLGSNDLKEEMIGGLIARPTFPLPGRALIVQRDGAARPKDHTGPNLTQCSAFKPKELAKHGLFGWHSAEDHKFSNGGTRWPQK